MKELWRPLAYVGVLVILLVFLLLRSASPDLDLRRDMQEQLQLFELHDAELTRDAVLTRAGLLPNYDALLHDRENLLSTLSALQRVSRSATADSGAMLGRSIDALSHALDEKLDQVERFKTDNALLRHSVAYLTYTISGMDHAQGATAVQAGDLSGSFLRFIQSPNGESSVEFKTALDHLADHGNAVEDLHSLVAHGLLLAGLLPQVVGQLRQIAAAPTTTRAGELQAQVEKVSGEAEARAQLYRYLLFFVSLVLLGYLVNQFARLRASARRLRRTNEELSHEIADREQAETALGASEGRFRAISESAHDAIISVDSNDVIVSWNPGATAIYGYSAGEILGEPMTRLLAPAAKGTAAPEEGSRALSAALAAGSTLETIGVRHDGSDFPLEASIGRWSNAQGVFATAIIRDVSERKRLEQIAQEQERKLVQANKMAALGTLVSGVAHEINNPNQMVLLNSSVLADAWRDACVALDAHREQEGEFTLAGLPYAEMRDAGAVLIRDLNEGARRIDRIVQDLKDFARPQRAGQQADVDVNEVAHQAVRLLTHLVNTRTRHFQVALSPTLAPVRGDAQQMEQVIVNLLVNALEALPDPSRSVIVTSRTRMSDHWIEIEVADEGVGIPAEHLQRLFDPFFTTKQDSGGTGLGLSVTFALVQAHGGRIDFDSEPGRGTRVTVSFPPRPAGIPMVTP